MVTRAHSFWSVWGRKVVVARTSSVAHPTILLTALLTAHFLASFAVASHTNNVGWNGYSSKKQWLGRESLVDGTGNGAVPVGDSGQIIPATVDGAKSKVLDAPAIHVAIHDVMPPIKGVEMAIAENSETSGEALAVEEVSAADSKYRSHQIGALEETIHELQLKIEEDLHRVEEDASTVIKQSHESRQAVRGEKIGSSTAKIENIAAVLEEERDKSASIDGAGDATINQGKMKHRVTNKGRERKEDLGTLLDHDVSANVETGSFASSDRANGRSTSAVGPSNLREDLQVVKQDIYALMETFARAKAQARDRLIETEREHEVEKEAARILEDLTNGRIMVDYLSGDLLVKGAEVKDVTEGAVTGEGRIGEASDVVMRATERQSRSQISQDVSVQAPLKVSREGLSNGLASWRQNSDGASGEGVAGGSNNFARSIESDIDQWITDAIALDNAQKELQSTAEGGKASGAVSHQKTVEFLESIKDRITLLKVNGDPAVMHMDLQLLLDVVTLAITAAIFGLVFVFLRLPPTAGFLTGGMLIGPSGWSLIEELGQVQTLASFGSIFLLFEQGLLYSQTYMGRGTLTVGGHGCRHSHGNNPSPVRSGSPRSFRSGSGTCVGGGFSDEQHDPNVDGLVVLTLLIFSALAILVFTGAVSSTHEAVMMAVSISVCSTSVVSENLKHASNIAHTPWASNVLKMIAMQDLFMLPLLAMPELIESYFEYGDGSWTLRLAFTFAFLKASPFVARHVVHAAAKADGRITGGGELFTLSIVAYALMIATVCEELQLSIDAGAIFAGVALMKSPHVPKILESIRPITSVFGGMYLTSLGMIISPAYVFSQLTSILWLVFFIAMFKMTLVSMVLNRFFDYSATASVAVGGAMAQISELSLVVMAKALRLGLVTRRTYLKLIPTTCILLALAPLSAANLRRLKVKDISADDGSLPLHSCVLRFISHFRRRRKLHPGRSIDNVASEDPSPRDE